jgi:hypothetical protein
MPLLLRLVPERQIARGRAEPNAPNHHAPRITHRNQRRRFDILKLSLSRFSPGGSDD